MVNIFVPLTKTDMQTKVKKKGYTGRMKDVPDEEVAVWREGMWETTYDVLSKATGVSDLTLRRAINDKRATEATRKAINKYFTSRR